MKGIRSLTWTTTLCFQMTTSSEDHDEGTESHEIEKSFLLISRESDYLTNLEKAFAKN